MPKGILERLSEGVVLGDGGYLLERRGYVQAGPFVPETSLTRPEALAGLHREFVDAGAEVIQTLTFYATEDKLATVGLEGRVDDMNRAAVRIAREVAGEAGGNVLVAGNLSETWGYDPGNPSTHRHVREMFDRQLAVMTEEGIDFVIAETFLWVGEALIAAEAIRDARLTGMVTMAFADEPVTYEGLSPGECVRRLADAGVEITGVNCLRSPEHILPIMEEMRSAAPDSVHLATQPVAFHGPHAHPNFTVLPEFPFELEKITLPRPAFGDFAVKARDLGFSYIGSCCGAVACHVREMARALGKVPAGEREWRSPTGRPMSGLELHQPEGR